METDNKLFINISAKNWNDLKYKYKAVNIDEIIERKIKYFTLKPFNGRSKLVWIDKIKEFDKLYDMGVRTS